MRTVARRILICTGLAPLVAGCMGDLVLPGGDTDLASQVAAKATTVAENVGGMGGFGGERMNGYFSHMPGHMGFNAASDLARAGERMTVRLHNESAEDCTFHLTYFAGRVGLDEIAMDVDVGAGMTEDVDVPCSEIVGLGPLEMPGEAACHLAGGQEVDNRLTVPGFLGIDFACQGAYECFLTPDVDDLDGDGDTDELIVISEAMETHMMDGGPMGHGHGMRLTENRLE